MPHYFTNYVTTFCPFISVTYHESVPPNLRERLWLAFKILFHHQNVFNFKYVFCILRVSSLQCITITFNSLQPAGSYDLAVAKIEMSDYFPNYVTSFCPLLSFTYHELLPPNLYE